MIPKIFIFSKTMYSFNPNDYNLIHAPADMKDGNP